MGDLRRHRRWLSLADLVTRRQQRLAYQQLYLKRMEKQSGGTDAATDEVSIPFFDALFHATEQLFWVRRFCQACLRTLHLTMFRPTSMRTVVFCL